MLFLCLMCCCTWVIPGMAQTALFVDSAASGNNTGQSWVNAYTKLSDALQSANAGSGEYRIFVARGTYYPTGIQSDTSRVASFMLKRANIKLYGGYDAATGNRNIGLYKSRMDGNIGSAITDTDNVYHVVVLGDFNTNDSVVIDGFTIEGGNANKNTVHYINGTEIWNYYGGGIYAKSKNFTEPRHTLSNCEISNNAATGWGSALYLGGALILNRCKIAGNKGHTATVIEQVPEIYNGLRMYNTIVSGNSCFWHTIGMASATFQNYIVNSTIADNEHNEVYASAGGSHFRNSILWKYGEGSSLYGPISVINSLYVGGSTVYPYPVVNSLFEPPLFVDPVPYTGPTTAGDYHLTLCSPAINKGDNTFLPAAFNKDFEGNSRIQYNIIDMGAYEVSEYYAQLNYVYPNSIACAGDSVYGLQPSIVQPGQAAHVTWYRTGPYIGLNQTSGIGNIPSFVAFNPTTSNLVDTFYVMATDSSGAHLCTKTWKVTIRGRMQPGFAPQESLCLGSSLTLNAGTAAGYMWSTGDTIQSVPVNAAGTYWVHSTSTAGCSQWDTVEVIAHALPVVDLGADQTICEGTDTLLLDAGNPGADYVWSSGDTSQSIAVLNSGVYWVKVTDSNGCVSGDTAIHTIITVPFIDSIHVSGTAPAYTFTAGTTVGGADYWWDFGDGFTDTAVFTVNHTYVTSGQYTLRLVTSNFCGADTLEKKIVVPSLGVASSGHMKEIKVYPNPVQKLLIIEHGKQSIVSALSMYTLSGQEVHPQRQDQQGKIILDVAPLPAGMYLLRLVLQDGNSASFPVQVIR